MKTIPTPLAHSDNEHSIVSLLHGACLEQAIMIQSGLKTLFGDAIWLQDPHSLHITLMEIICDTDYGDLPRAKLFQDWHAAYNLAAKDTLSRFTPFNLVFDELLVSQRAIIIKSSRSEELNSIRASLLANISLPQGTKNPPDITHATLARFTESLDLQKVIDGVKDIRVVAKQHVAEFSLVKDLGPPIFNGTPMERYPLAGQ